jgi:hypothetical protein
VVRDWRPLGTFLGALYFAAMVTLFGDTDVSAICIPSTVRVRRVRWKIHA